MSRHERLDALRGRHGGRAPWLAVAGGVVLLVSGLLSWSYDGRILGDISIRGYPAGIQVYAMVIGAVALLLGLLLRRRPQWLNPGRGLRALGVGAIVFVLGALLAISVQAGGVVNANEGVWVALTGAVLVLVSGVLTAPVEIDVRTWPRLPSWAEILVIVALMTVLLFTIAYTLGMDDSATFGCLLIMILAVITGLIGSGFGEYLGFIAANNRRVLVLSTFVVAFLFPFTQNGSSANMSVATQILIFAATALGLNIVVGLAGLLDLGYIAFLGTGAYVGAMLSQSAFATVGWKPPFLVVMLCGMAVAAIFG